MKRIISIAMSLVLCAAVLAGCGGEAGSNVSLGEVVKYDSLEERLEAYGLDENRRFIEPRSITVEVFDRNNDGGTDPTNNMYTDYIKEGMLRDHNVIVEYIAVPRWEEVTIINNYLAAGNAPDICVTYNYNTVQTYGKMQAVWDLNPFIDESEELFPHLWNLVGATNLYWDQDPVTKHVWAIETLLFNNMRTNTFVREDWLKKLELDEPTTEAEFEAMLIAFRDNAELLLGDDAAQMVPFGLQQDVGWQASRLLESYIPESITDREFYIYGLSDRRLFQPGIKEGTRTLNKWFNDGLVEPDFTLYGAGDDIAQNKFKAGYVGAFIHNWDYPYRDGDQGITASLHRLVGEDAAYIAINPFQNDEGVYRQFLSAPVDRKVFFPATNDEPVASMLYLDFISNFENRKFLQIGEEGKTHEVLEDGTIKSIPAEAPYIINSANNIDLTLTINGLDMGDPDLNARSTALGYASVPSYLIEKAYAMQMIDRRIGKQVSVGALDSEEGLGNIPRERADALWATSITAAPADFDKVWDDGMKTIMDNFGAAVEAERTEKYKEYYGDIDFLP